jgi:hypothetical protein
MSADNRPRIHLWPLANAVGCAWSRGPTSPRSKPFTTRGQALDDALQQSGFPRGFVVIGESAP